jgi:rhodanese-related sulfurtransferase
MTGIPQTSPRELHDWLAAGEAMLVDVREVNEFAAERIPGALLHPLSTFEPKAIPTLRPRLVLQCGGGGRSMRAAQVLVAAGHEQVYNLDGGIKAWKALGLPLIRIDPATGQVERPGQP